MGFINITTTVFVVFAKSKLKKSETIINFEAYLLYKRGVNLFIILQMSNIYQ